MLWLAIEILLGLALFVGIVWWTLPRRTRDRHDHPPAPNASRDRVPPHG